VGRFCRVFYNAGFIFIFFDIQRRARGYPAALYRVSHSRDKYNVYSAARRLSCPERSDGFAVLL